MAAYMRDKFSYFGLPTPKRREIAKQFFANDKKTDEIDWALVFECFAADERERELQYAAMDYIKPMSQSEFDKDIFTQLVDKIVVKNCEQIIFVLKDGSEINGAVGNEKD